VSDLGPPDETGNRTSTGYVLGREAVPSAVPRTAQLAPASAAISRAGEGYTLAERELPERAALVLE
jgi:hypothetical protein